MRKFLVIGLALFLLVGAIGFKTREDCEGIRDEEKISCYHIAAIALAYAENSSGAQGLCNDIYYSIGMDRHDLSKKAETQKNLCLFDIAKIIAREPKNGEADALAICEDIEQGNYSTVLSGADATKEMCKNEVSRIVKIRPDHYFAEGQDNICSIVFILPLLLLASFFRD